MDGKVPSLGLGSQFSVMSPIKMGASSGTGLELPKILNMALGRQIFNVIPGYRGTYVILLAVRARELDGLCQGFESMRIGARAMLDARGDEKLIPFMIHGHAEDPEVKDITQLRDVCKGKESQAMLNA